MDHLAYESHDPLATELAALIRRKKVSPVEVVGAVLARIEKLNPILNAYVTVTADQARRDARAARRVEPSDRERGDHPCHREELLPPRLARRSGPR